MDTDDIKQPSLWIPMTDPIDLAHIGKLGEEAAELARICSRIVIQGIGSADPDSKLMNYTALQQEIADVYAMAGLCIARFRLDVDQIQLREQLKKTMKRTWFEMLRKALAPTVPSREAGEHSFKINQNLPDD